jgi:hypothetical protein
LFGRFFQVVVLIFDRRREESRWWELVTVSSYDNLSCTVESWDRLFLQNLTRLIENYNVEVALTAIQQLADGEGAGDPTRSYSRQHVWGTSQQLPQRNMSGLLSGLCLHDVRLVEMGVHGMDCSFTMQSAYAFSREPNPFTICFAEVFDQLIVRPAIERCELRLRTQHVFEGRVDPDILKTGNPFVGRYAIVAEIIKKSR